MRFLIKHGLTLSGVYLQPNTYHTATEEEATILRDVFLPDGAVEELVPQEPKEETKKEAPNVAPLTAIPGIGKKLLDKLTEAGVTTEEQMKKFMETEEAKELLGLSYDKILKHFS
jgi:predicted flap endonuclease-1-like 5' DNA nuclease